VVDNDVRNPNELSHIVKTLKRRAR